MAQRAEQRRRFKAVLCNKPRTYAQIREERKRSTKEGTAMIIPQTASYLEDAFDDERVLDGFFLVIFLNLSTYHAPGAVSVFSAHPPVFQCYILI